MNKPERIAALHDRSQPLGRADIVLLQEMRLAAPQSLPRSNPLQRLHYQFSPQAHQAVLGQDAGIILRNTKWVIETSLIGTSFAYAHVRIPASEAALGRHVRSLHIWSIHAPPADSDRREFWNSDTPELSRIDSAVMDEATGAIVGADWNAIQHAMLDSFPPGSTSASNLHVPHGILARAGLVDVYRTLHPTGVAYTRYNQVQGTLVSARRIDGISVSHTLVPHLNSIETRPSLSDHSVVAVRIGSNAPRSDLGPGVWRLHRDAHLLPGFQLRIAQYAAQLPPNVQWPPIQRYFHFVERIRATASNIATTLSQKAQKNVTKRAQIAERIAGMDIFHGDDTRALFLELLDQLRRLDRTHADAAHTHGRAMFESNMFRPTAWIIPKLESRTFAGLPDLQDDTGHHTTIEAKLIAIQRFYTTLFTPRPRDRSSEEATSILLSSIRRTISTATKHKLEAPFTVDELRPILKRAREESSPGMDGLTYPLLRALGDDGLAQICLLGNALFRGHQLPAGEPMLRGVLLPKKGDLSRLGNYRPLSIATAAFRLLGGAISDRLQAASNEVVHAAQTGFIVGRSSALNLVTLSLLQRAVDNGEVPGPVWILNLDQQKAYDRVRLEWLLESLQSYGFGPRFLTYIREMYRHPSVRQSAEGHMTEPIPLACGILQGDPMSPLLYNLSLQPLLDYARNHHHAETTIQTDTTHPLRLSSLAFADDILLIVNNKGDLLKFLDSLELYELASNAKVNQEKSQAFQFGPPRTDEDALNADEIPFPTLGEPRTEIVHLGYPFRLDGGIPHAALERRITAIQAKVNILSTTKSSLFARVKICNSFLLTKLWHTVRLCPLPHDFQRSINTVVNPYLFLGRRNWIRHEIVIAPRHVGGLGVISSNFMTIALMGQILAGLLLSTEPTGYQFRAALQDHMWKEYKAIPAHFILRRGIPWRLMNSILTAQKSFMHRVVYTLCQLRLSVRPAWEELSTPELLALPFFHNMFGFTWPTVSTTTACAWERGGLRVWGDILWYNPGNMGKVPHPYAILDSHPLVPPSPSGCKNNYVATRGHPDNFAQFSEAAGRLLSPNWAEMWKHLHPTVRQKLRRMAYSYSIHPDHSTSVKNPRPHDRPFVIDTVGLPFPWRIATLADKPLAEYTVKHARAFQAPDKIIMPDWDFTASEAEWRQVWEWQTQENILTSEAQSDVFLFLQRRPWLAQKPRADRRLPSYATLDDQTLAPRTQMFVGARREPADDTEPEPEEEPTPDSYEIEHVYGVAECMLCAGPKDSAAHGFIECEHAKAMWKAIMPTLRKMVKGRGVPIDTRNVVLGWPGLKMPKPLRARLLLWRDLTIHLLVKRRKEAIADGLKNDHKPRLDLAGLAIEHVAIVTKTISDAYDKCDTAKRPAFAKRWLDNGIFLRELNGRLCFHPMSNTASTSATASTTTPRTSQPASTAAAASSSATRDPVREFPLPNTT